MVCCFSGIFGTPNTGIHSIRILNIAVVDMALTLLFAHYIHKTFDYDFYKVSLSLITLSIFVHKLFGVETTLVKLVFDPLFNLVKCA